MKLMSYNIFDGAATTLPFITQVVQREKPDYLVLNEANTFARRDNELLKHFAAVTKFPYFDLALSGEQDFHVAVCSRYPFLEVYKPQPLSRACHIALVATPFGSISIASLHLSPTSEKIRYSEIERIVSYQKKYSQRILIGDMNSLSGSDSYKKNLLKKLNHIQRKKFTLNGKLRFDVINKIYTEGYIDVAVKLRRNDLFTVPTPVNKDAAHSALRLDYVFVSESLSSRLHSYSVLQNDLTHIASDHYPITVELQNN
jgi:exodeoxyribonuclease-3